MSQIRIALPIPKVITADCSKVQLGSRGRCMQQSRTVPAAKQALTPAAGTLHHAWLKYSGLRTARHTYQGEVETVAVFAVPEDVTLSFAFVFTHVAGRLDSQVKQTGSQVCPI